MNTLLKEGNPLIFIRKVVRKLNIQFNKKCVVFSKEAYPVSSSDINTLARISLHLIAKVTIYDTVLSI
jgi:hypothetical protein